jgi:hypothetical protein
MLIASSYDALIWEIGTVGVWILLLMPGAMSLVLGRLIGEESPGPTLNQVGLVLLVIGALALLPVTFYIASKS